MSPEQARGEGDLTPNSDVFALGSVLVFASAGHPPFHGGHVFAVLNNIRFTAPDLDGVPATMVPIVAACLEKEPANRPRLAALLNAAASPGPTPTGPPNPRCPRPLVAPTILTSGGESFGVLVADDRGKDDKRPCGLTEPGSQIHGVVTLGTDCAAVIGTFALTVPLVGNRPETDAAVIPGV